MPDLTITAKRMRCQRRWRCRVIYDGFRRSHIHTHTHALMRIAYALRWTRNPFPPTKTQRANDVLLRPLVGARVMLMHFGWRWYGLILCTDCHMSGEHTNCTKAKVQRPAAYLFPNCNFDWLPVWARLFSPLPAACRHRIICCWDGIRFWRTILSRKVNRKWKIILITARKLCNTKKLRQ